METLFLVIALAAGLGLPLAYLMAAARTRQPPSSGTGGAVG